MKFFQRYYDFGVIILLILVFPIFANFDPNLNNYGPSFNVYDPFTEDISFQDIFYSAPSPVDDRFVDSSFEPDFFETETSLDMSNQRLFDLDKRFNHEDSSSILHEPPFTVLYPNHQTQEQTFIVTDVTSDEPESLGIDSMQSNEYESEDIAFNDDFISNDPLTETNSLTFIDPDYDPNESNSILVRNNDINDFYKDSFVSSMFNQEANPIVIFDTDLDQAISERDNKLEEPKRGFFGTFKSKFSSPKIVPKDQIVIDDSFESIDVDQDMSLNSIGVPSMDSEDNMLSELEAIKEEKIEDLVEVAEAKKSLVSRFFDGIPHPGHIIEGIIEHHHHDKPVCTMDHFLEVVLYDLDKIHDLYTEMEMLKPTHEISVVQTPVEDNSNTYVENHYDPHLYGPHYIEQTRNSVRFHSNQLPSQSFENSPEPHPISTPVEYFHEHYDDYHEPNIKYDLLHFIPKVFHTGHNVFTNMEENFLQAKETIVDLMPDLRRTRFKVTEPAEPEYIPDEIVSFYDEGTDVYEELWIKQNHPEYLTPLKTVVIENPVVYEPNLQVVTEEVIVDSHPHLKPCFQDTVVEIQKTIPLPFAFETINIPRPHNSHNNMLTPTVKSLDNIYNNNHYYIESNSKPIFVNNPQQTYSYPYPYSNTVVHGSIPNYQSNYPNPNIKPYQGFPYA